MLASAIEPSGTGVVAELPGSDRAWSWFLRTWTAIGVGVVLWGVVHLFREPIHLLIPPIVLAAIIIYLLSPIVAWFERMHLPRVLGTALAYLLVLGALVGVGFLLVPVVVDQATALGDRLPDIAVSLQDWLNAQLERLGSDATVSLDPDATETQRAFEDFFESNQEEVLGVLRSVGAYAVGLIASLVGVVLAPVIAFYALVDLPRLSDGMRRLIPPRSRSEVIDVAGRITRTVGAYVRGQLLVSIFVGVATTIGLAAIGLPFWALVGLLAGVFNLVPFVGPFVGGALGALIALTIGGGLGQAVVVVLVMVLVQQVDNHVITPNIISRTVHVHPVTILLALAVSASLFGILGMLVAIPVVAALKLVVLYVLVTRVPSMAHLAGDGPDVIDGVPVTPPGDNSLVSMGRDLRAAYQARRRRREDEGDVGGS